ncbi:MAG: hypothetical protein ACRECA_01330, partial [Pseudolabrys sp.]
MWFGARVGLAAVTLVTACGTQAAGGNPESTARQRTACKPDVYRLCKLYIPSHDGITYCLHKNIEQLSPQCRAVMEG